jgi:hypothetical protein
MKKFLIATSLLTLTTTSFAATSGTLILQGIVAKKVSIVVTPQAVASALVLETSQTDLKVATAVEQSNSSTGYKVTVSSANLGKLKRTDGSEVFSYTLKYGGASVGLSTAAGSVVTNSSSASVVNVSKDMAISYTGVAAETMVEGTYADTLTVNIASN